MRAFSDGFGVGANVLRYFRNAAAAAALVAAPAAAQDQGVVQPGNAVVTGFSGFSAFPAPADQDPFDYLTVNLDGPSAEVIDLSYLGAKGQLSDALKTFAISAAEVGQVFGVALDNAPNPNIYLAATSVYGLSVYLPDGTDTIRRIRLGTPGAQFVPGQFGPPEWGAGPGSIWRVDGTTGEVLLFANIDAAGPASLGGLAFDPGSRQLFVADRTTGIVHRFGLDGTEQGVYDHGVEGRRPYGLPPITYSPQPPVDINASAFDPESRATWGFAVPARRIFALAVKDSRLYYSVAQGPQIWSVGISQSGAVAASPRLEVEVPSLGDGVEITAITFDGAGRMYLAERGPTTADYEMTNLATGGQSRVLRFVPKPANDPNPSNWRLVPEEYAIGLAPAYRNADGGVALGYGYRPDNVIDYNVCRGTLWSTGERLLDPGDLQRPPGSFPAVDGLQGNAPALVAPQNRPPLNAWYIEYDDAPGSPDYRGLMGAVTVYSPCAVEAPYVPPPQTISCPPGTVYDNGQCVVTVSCPPGSVYSNGKCVYETCPPGYVLQGGQCVPPPIACPPGMAYYNGKCVPLECPPGMERLPNGQCVCPPDKIFFNGKCQPPNICPPGMVKYPNGICWCPVGTDYVNGKCVPNWCPKGYVPVNGKCVPEQCPPGFHKGPNGFCVPDFVPCKAGEILVKGKCVPKVCPPFQQLGPDGKCHPVLKPCKPGEVVVNGQCVPKKCPPLQQLAPDGKCHPIVITCPQGTQWDGGKGKCVSICKPNQQFVNGKCVPLPVKPPPPPKCKPNEQLVNGKCVPLPVKPPPQAGGCDGIKVGGACWYASSSKQSCSQVCSKHGGYDNATKNYAGSGGSNGKCEDVLKALSVGNGKVTTMNGKGYGCFFNVNGSRTRDKANTDPDASATGAIRACACNK